MAVRHVRAVVERTQTEIEIATPFIRLDSFLKFSGTAETGGSAKAMIESGRVMVNGEPEYHRGRKLYGGEIVSVGRNDLRVVKNEGTKA